jgi:hypothetical protein
MVRQFVVNGKFLRAESTGVHRVATELANALAALDREGHPALDVVLACLAKKPERRPADGAAVEALLRSPKKKKWPFG